MRLKVMLFINTNDGRHALYNSGKHTYSLCLFIKLTYSYNMGLSDNIRLKKHLSG